MTGPEPSIEKPDVVDAERITQLWVDLANEQRQHGSTLGADSNRDRMHTTILNHVVDGRVLVARSSTEEADSTDDADVVGFVTYEVVSGRYHEDDRRGLVSNIYVVPARRNEGIGERLLSAAESDLCDAGCSVVGVEAMAANDAAQRFYRGCGYERHRVEFRRRIENDTDSRDGSLR